ncbi:MAG: monovalent cation/H(+) antiporter subunit G [Thermoanaerobaculia bacterium]
MELIGEITDWLSWACLLGGSLVLMTTGVALLRLPSYYSRVHGASLSDGLGAGLILTGLIFQVLPPEHLPGDLLIAGKLATVLFFMLFTGPVAAHALAKAAYLHGLEPGPERAPTPGPEPPTDPAAGPGDRGGPSSPL